MTLLSETSAADRTAISYGSPTWRVRLGRLMAGSAMLLVAVGVIELIVVGRVDFLTRDYAGVMSIWAVGFSLLTWLAVPHQPRNKAVWVVGVAALLTAIGISAWGLAILAADIAGLETAFEGGWYALSPLDVPFVSAVAWMVNFVGLFSGFLLIVTVGLLLFPDGKPPSPHWGWLAWACAVVVPLTGAAIAWEWRPTSTLPFDRGSDSFAGVGRLVNVLIPVVGVFVVLTVAALVVGYRRSTGVTRQQHKWITWGGIAFVLFFVPVIASQPAVPTGTDTGWRVFAFLGATVALIGSYGVAVTRYRLYDIDLVVNRTMVFAVLIGFITLVYALIVVGLGRIIGGGDGLVLPILATAVVAVAFEPVRQQAQRWANKVVYGRRATPYEVLADLTGRLAMSVSSEGILARMARLLHDGTGAERATLWLGSPEAMEAAATWPQEASPGAAPDPASAHVFEVKHDSRVVGALEVVKPRGSTLSHQERSLIADVAGSAGLILGYQRLNDSLARNALEVAESRRRLVRAQDDERMKLESDLRDGAQQRIAGLLTSVGTASDLARMHGSAELVELLDGLSHEAEEALDEVRSLAKGIYPSVLVSEGLSAALPALASGAPVEVSVSCGEVARYSEEVEAAVYFDIAESVTNAVKHATPPIEIALSEHQGELRFSVADSGPGFDPGSTATGSGLVNMRDRLDALGGRLEITSRPGGRTVITGRIPMAERVSA